MALQEIVQAKAKLAEALSAASEDAIQTQAADGFEFENPCRDSIKIAREALVSCRRAQDSENKLEALKIAVRGMIAVGDSFDALMLAQDELAMIKNIKGDEKYQVMAMLVVLEVLYSRDDFKTGLQVSTEGLALAKELGMKEQKAFFLQKLAHCNIALNKAAKAIPLAEESLALNQELEDEMAASVSTNLINIACAESGKIDKAPGRAAALSILQDLLQAASTSNHEAWRTTWDELNKNGAYNYQDLKTLCQGNREAKAFFKSMGVDLSGGEAESGFKHIQIPKQITYVLFRFGGLGYGPRFRCQEAAYRAYKQAGPAEGKQVYAMSAIKIQDCADDWERELEWNPSVLDCGLQTGAAVGAPRSL